AHRAGARPSAAREGVRPPPAWNSSRARWSSSSPPRVGHEREGRWSASSARTTCRPPYSPATSPTSRPSTVGLTRRAGPARRQGGRPGEYTPRVLLDAAAVVVDGPTGLVELLRQLTGETQRVRG